MNTGANFSFELNFLDLNMPLPAVPEPATWALALMGLVGVAQLRQRQQA